MNLLLEGIKSDNENGVQFSKGTVNILITEIERCHEAMKEFCERRDNGQVISHYTYMKFRKILDGVE